MKNAIVNLLKVKSLLSIGCLAVFIILALRGSISGETALTIISIVFTYFFTKKDGDTNV